MLCNMPCGLFSSFQFPQHRGDGGPQSEEKGCGALVAVCDEVILCLVGLSRFSSLPFLWKARFCGTVPRTQSVKGLFWAH